MAPAPKLIGRRFGHLTVVARDGIDKVSKMSLWKCECSCGNTVSVRGPFLTKGQRFCSKQCPEYAKENRLDITGKRFGRLTAIKFIKPSGKSHKALWSFKCDCGNTTERLADNVQHGDIRSCGCLGIESRIKHGKSKTLEYHREAHKRWAKRNPAKSLANAKMRVKNFCQRVPKWLTKEHWKQINAFYIQASELTEKTGIQHHVDHIIPLRGKMVSGLHVPWNLQVITRDENLHKGAKFSDEVC